MQGTTSLSASDQYDQADATASYFECITSCDIDDGVCVQRCVLVHLKQGDEGGG